MSKSLNERLLAARMVLDQTDEAIRQGPAAMPPDVEDSLRKIVDNRGDIDHWLGMLTARDAAFQILDRLETKVDGSDCVPLGATVAKFQHVRHIGVQAYVSTNWALADRVAGFIGRMLCTPESALNPKSPPQLVSHFITDDAAKKRCAAFLRPSIQRIFGWPIAISYAIRNHFVHDGGHVDGNDFFEGPTGAAAFRISAKGWENVQERAGTYGVLPVWVRPSANWPAVPRDDLRVLLSVCEREMDDALGILLGSACHSLRMHVGFVLGLD